MFAHHVPLKQSVEEGVEDIGLGKEEEGVGDDESE